MSNKLAVTVHGNDEVTVRDERGVPDVCKNCRFAGWLTEYEFRMSKSTDYLPVTCLHYSGGADPHDGDRVIFDDVTRWGNTDRQYVFVGPSHWDKEWKNIPISGHLLKVSENRERYPECSEKNHDGKCGDFVPAKPEPERGGWQKFWESKGERLVRIRKMRP